MTAVNVLIVEDNEADAIYIQRKLLQGETAQFTCSRVQWLSSAIQVIESRPPDCVLLDLSLPDSQGVDTVVEMVKRAPNVPIVVMTGFDDMTTAMNAVRVGAQDYLIKNEIQAKPLERTILLAIERKRVDEVGKQLMHSSLTTFNDYPAKSPNETMVRDHVSALVGAFDDVTAYIQKNAPAHADAVQAIFAGRDIAVVVREMRDILRIGTARPRKISNTILSAVREITGKHDSEPPTDLPSAQGSVLDVIQRRERFRGV